MTCADPRCVPQAFFGPEFRGSVHQNAGGRVTEDVIRSYNVLRALANLKVVLVVHHTGIVTSYSDFLLIANCSTDCGMTHVTKDEIRDVATSKNPAAAVEVDEMDLGLFKPEDLEETVKEDVRKLRSEKTLDGLEVYGFILETDKGVVREIDV